MANPQYDFDYTNGRGYYYGSDNNFFVQDGKIQARILPPEVPKKLANDKLTEYEKDKLRNIQATQFFIFDIKNKTAKPISFDEAQLLQINPASVSPDGYEFTRARRTTGVFPFFMDSHSSSNYILKKGLATVGLPIGVNNAKFIGWIIK